MVNTLTLHSVGQQHTASRFSCRASNNNVTRPVGRTLAIRVNFPPTEVSIIGLAPLLLAGRAQKLRCVVSGSRPAASISWWMDER